MGQMSLTKRDTIALLAAFALAACGAGYRERKSERVPGADKKRVLVVGAGMSGAKAARVLDSAGFNVVVLEARDRIGGRTWTDKGLGAPVDLGASWIHGRRGNPITKLAKEIGAPIYNWDYGDAELFNEGGVGDGRFMLAYDSFENKVYAAAEKVIARNPAASVQDVIDAMKADGAFGKLNEKEINFLVHGSIEANVAADADQVLAAGLVIDEEFGGGDAVLPGGYGQLTAALLQDLDVRINHEVTAVDMIDDIVRVDTNKGAFEADYVVVTAPLGVLKASKIAFAPPLPETKQRAIDGLAMGVLNKVFLRFPEVFWNPKRDNIVNVTEERGAFSLWFSLAQATGAPVLVSLISGAFGASIEGMSDDEVVERAMATLRSMYGDEIPRPTGHRITRWIQDPYAHGSYSYTPMGASVEMFDDLAAPVGERLFFAGEATIADYYATVHGAYLSGLREANRIIELVANK